MQTETATKKKNSKQIGWDAVMDESEKLRLAKAYPSKTFTEDVLVDLTEQELDAEVDSLAELRDKRPSLEETKRAATEALKDHLKAEEAQTAIVCSRQKLKPLELREDYLWNVGSVQTTRVDTGTIVRERAISAVERQQGLFPEQFDEGCEEP